LAYVFIEENNTQTTHKQHTNKKKGPLTHLLTVKCKVS